MSKADTIRVTEEQIEYLEKKILAHRKRRNKMEQKILIIEESLHNLFNLLHKKEDFLSTLEEADNE